MRKTISSALFVLLLCATAGMAHAKLTVIGHVEYQKSSQSPVQTFLLVWDDADEDGESVVWLDYTNNRNSWDNQQIWLNLLNDTGGDSPIRKIVLEPGYSVDWGNNPWRMPRTVDGPFVEGSSGTTTGGYNVCSSELGHLFYKELRNSAQRDINGAPLSTFGLVNKGPFEHIAPYEYWSGTTYAAEPNPPRAWWFRFSDGFQGAAPKTSTATNPNYPYGLALRKATVRYSKPAGTTLRSRLVPDEPVIDRARRN